MADAFGFTIYTSYRSSLSKANTLSLGIFISTATTHKTVALSICMNLKTGKCLKECMKYVYRAVNTFGFWKSNQDRRCFQKILEFHVHEISLENIPQVSQCLRQQNTANHHYRPLPSPKASSSPAAASRSWSDGNSISVISTAELLGVHKDSVW